MNTKISPPDDEQRKLCVVSMSGGLDSTTLAVRAIHDGYVIQPINIKYGQKNAIEKESFKTIYEYIKKEYPDQIMEPIILDLESMLDSSINMYKRIRDSGQVHEKTEMEFYTPSRNLVFSTLAAMVGEIAAIASSKTEVRIGLGIHKHSEYDRDYWDITPEFVKRLNFLFELNDCMNVEMYAPYAEDPKSTIVRDAIKMGVPYKNTWTCYNPAYKPLLKNTADGTVTVDVSPCLKCEACIERQKAGEEANIHDINDYKIAAVIKAEDLIEG